MGEKMEKKVGVYICKGCGIDEAVDVEKFEEVATKEMKAPVYKTHDALCSPEGIDLIKGDIEGEGVNTVVVTACSPRVKHKEFVFPGCGRGRGSGYCIRSVCLPEPGSADDG